MQQLVNTLLGGLTLGMVYAAFALALVLIWRSTRIVNFAQAPMAMVTTFVALRIIEGGHSYWLGFAAALLAGLVLGAVIERTLVRPVEGKAELNAVILTLGLFIVLHALAAVVFGNRYRSFPAAFGIRSPRSVKRNSSTSRPITASTARIVKIPKPVRAIVMSPTSIPRMPNAAGKER